MTPVPKPPGPKMGSVLRGIVQVARGQKAGLDQFGDSPAAVLSALTPLVAFLIVGGLVALVGGAADALSDVAAVTIGLLGPLVFSYEVARRWGRGVQWPRFAAAFCWCQWAAPMVLALVLILMALLMSGGMSGDTAAAIGVVILFGYGLWLLWFLARHALDLSAFRAAALVVIVNVMTMGLIILPQVAYYLLNGAASP